MLGWRLLLFGLTYLKPSYQSMDTCLLLNGRVKMAFDFTGSVPELIPSKLTMTPIKKKRSGFVFREQFQRL